MMKMKKAVLVYEGVAYDEFKFDVEVEEIEMMPQKGCRVFTPGVVTYTVRLLNGKKFVTNVHPYRFEYQGAHYFVFHTI